MRNGTRIHIILNYNYAMFGIHLHILIYHVKKKTYASTKIYYVGLTICII